MDEKERQEKLDFLKKRLKRVIDVIKNAADLVYEKPNSGLTAGNNPKKPAISDTTQLLNNIPQTTLNVNGNKGHGNKGSI